MAEWPELEELKQVLNVDPDGNDDWDATLGLILASAIEKVKADVGEWDDDVDSPTDALSRAALRMAELMAQRPTVLSTFAQGRQSRNASLSDDPAYQAHLFGSRKRFGFG